MSESTEKLIEKAKKTSDFFHALTIAKLLQKDLKATWKPSSLTGFFDVMASLHNQVKDWQWPSDSLFESMRPKDVTTLVICLEERRK